MPIIHHPGCSTSSFFKPCARFTNYCNNFSTITPLVKHSKSRLISFERLYFSSKLEKVRRAHVRLCAENGVLEEVGDTILPRERESEESEELELLNKPSPKIVDNGPVEEVVENDQKKPDRDEVLETFYKFFKPFEEEIDPRDIGNESSIEKSKKVSVEYYEPKRGDLVVGVVVSGNESKLDVSVGADLLGTMLTKEVLPLYDKEMDHLLWDVERDAELLVWGKMGIVKNEEALSGEPMPAKPVVEPGTVLFAEVLGRTLGGRPLLSTRRLFRRIAWHRVRQLKQLNEPLEIKITEWNTGGLLTRIEGLRAFIPKAELINRVNNYTELKENVGRRIYVQITRINEETNDLILSEKEAWAMMHLQEGTLLEGTVKKIFPYGAQIRIGDTNRSGLLHISNITRGRVNSVSDLLAIDEQVKVLVVKSTFPDKISVSIADLESEPGLFLSDKEKVFSEAKVMAKKYKHKTSVFSATRKLEALPTCGIPFEDEERLCANWKWFKFERDGEKAL
ncbi:protein PIGMENT DEFECTIVE 338, chloroplastic [Primulina huaijiensis]|uniref:protein PIGMENT DEFECTIVE 338, chloroplastic n=1 Tax=Primulina huaijiensis TaxID=1492673 RepID=UPI003CC71E27